MSFPRAAMRAMRAAVEWQSRHWLKGEPMYALLIPEQGPIVQQELDGSLAQLQGLVGGFIEALPIPEFIPGSDRATAYVNEEGKFHPNCKPNMRATDFMVPGIGLFMGDYIAGPFLLCGFDPARGENTDLPDEVEARVRLIEREAA
jgi:hypothetical protein